MTTFTEPRPGYHAAGEPDQHPGNMRGCDRLQQGYGLTTEAYRPVMRVGSLCTGYGGLELGAERVFGPLQHVWQADIDPAASAVLAARRPGVPNLGDITELTVGTSAHGGWADLSPVDAVFAGYPCQGESNAGLRKGADDPRFRWPDVHAAVRALRPGLVILENVRGHLNRSFPRVVADLAGIGYVGRWRCVRASDVGAAHRRERLFAVAWPAEGAPPRLPGTGIDLHDGDLTPLLPTPNAALGRGAGFPSPELAAARFAAGRRFLDDAVALLPTPIAVHWARNATADRRAVKPNTNDSGWTLADVAYADRWGSYGPAIARWEAVIGRPAPEPTVSGRRGSRLLSPLFVEWLMGLSAGWVTDVVDHRGSALRVLGNGVVPQAAEHALYRLLGAADLRRAAA